MPPHIIIIKVTDPYYVDISEYKINTLQMYFYDCCAMGNLPAVEKILKQSPELAEPVQWDLSTPLHYACRYGRSSVVKFLCAKGFDINAQDILGNTPMHEASKAGKIDLCEAMMGKYPNNDKTPEFNDFPIADGTIRNKLNKVAYKRSRTKKANKKALQPNGDKLSNLVRILKYSNVDQLARFMNSTMAVRSKWLGILENAFISYVDQKVDQETLSFLRSAISILLNKKFDIEIAKTFVDLVVASGHEKITASFEEKRLSEMPPINRLAYQWQ